MDPFTTFLPGVWKLSGPNLPLHILQSNSRAGCSTGNSFGNGDSATNTKDTFLLTHVKIAIEMGLWRLRRDSMIGSVKAKWTWIVRSDVQEVGCEKAPQWSSMYVITFILWSLFSSTPTMCSRLPAPLHKPVASATNEESARVLLLGTDLAGVYSVSM